jgi:tetratricopeptide (TPR) repeat protein
MLNKIFKARKQDVRKSEDRDLVAVKGGSDVIEQLEACRRRGEQPDVQLLLRAAAMYRALGHAPRAFEKYCEAAVAYITEEAWTPAEKVLSMADSFGGPREARRRVAMLALEVAVGRREPGEARKLLGRLSDLLTPADADEIERLVHVVDRDLLAPAEIELALAETLAGLGRPQRSLERLKIGLNKGRQAGQHQIVADIEGRIATTDVGRAAGAATAPTPVQARPAVPAWQPPEPGAAPASPSADTHQWAVGAAADAAPPTNEDALLAAVRVDEPFLALYSDPLAGDIDLSLDELGLEPLAIDERGAAPPLEAAPEVEQQGEIVIDLLEDDLAEAAPPAAPLADRVAATATAQPTSTRDAAADEVAPVITDGKSAATAPFVQLADLLRHERDDVSGRITGRDKREAGAADDEAFVQDLLQQFSEGISRAVPEDEAATYYDLGVGFLGMFMYDQAVQYFQTAYRSEAYRLRAAQGLAEALVGRGDARIALRVARFALEDGQVTDRDSLELLYWQARALEMLGRSSDAEELYERVLMYDIGFRDAGERLTALTG